MSNLWTETDTDVLAPHAFFGGVECWLKNGDNTCGKPYKDEIHKLEYPECEHVYICEKCGNELLSSPATDDTHVADAASVARKD